MTAIKIQRFDGGTGSLSGKVGIENSARFTKAGNIFEDPSYFTLAKETSKISSTTVTGLPHWFEDGSPWDTNRYAYDSAGKIYTINSSDTVSLSRTVSGGAGEGLVVHDNGLYYALATDIGRYFPLDNTPTFNDALTSWHNASDLQTTGGGTGEADYVPPTTISEAATARQTFTATSNIGAGGDPVVSIVIDVDVVGTGNWTVTLHDSNNRTVGSKTTAVGDMVVGDNTFTFASVLRTEPGETYHFHITSTVADGGVDTDAATDLEGAEFTVNYGVLLDDDWHMMARFFRGWVIGNERYLGFFDRLGGIFNPCKIKLDPGFHARSVYTVEEYLVVEVWKGQSFQEAEENRRYFWDGLENAYNYAEPLPGAPNAGMAYRNSIVGIYGNRGAIYAGSKPISKVTDKSPKLPANHYIEVYPGAMSEYEERLVIGYGAVTDDGDDLEQGVWEYGSQSSELANTLNFPYIISTGETQGTTLKIGAVKSFGTDLYIGWRDDTSYGIDKVAVGNNSTDETASWESRIFDGGDPNKTKQAIKLEVEFEDLVSGDSVTPKYRIDRAASFTSGTAVTTAGANEANLYINSNFKEIEFGFDLSQTGSTYPKVTGVNFVYQPNEDEGEEE